MIDSVTNIFSNREMAISLWLAVFIIWGIYDTTMRASFVDVLKAFFVKRIVMVVLLMVSYVALITWLLYVSGLWDISQFKNTVLWCLTVATVMLYRANVISENKHFFKDAVLDNLKIIVIFEFIVNLHSLSLWLELILVPFSTFLILLIAFAELDEKHKTVATILNRLLIVLGTALVAYAIYAVTTDIPSFTTYDNLQSFVLPPILSVAYLPFIYVFALFMAYEVLFVRYGFFTEDQEILNNAKKITLKKINVNLYNLKQWGHHITYEHFKHKDNISAALHEFKATI